MDENVQTIKENVCDDCTRGDLIVDIGILCRNINHAQSSVEESACLLGTLLKKLDSQRD